MGRQTRWINVGKTMVGIAMLAIVPAYGVSANRFTSPNYTIDASVGNSFGGTTSGTNYRMVSSGGETIAGNGSGGSYKLTQGYVAQLEKSLQLTVQPAGLAAYYPMDEAMGKGTSDASVNNQRASFFVSPEWDAGKVSHMGFGYGVGLYFTDDGLDVPHSTPINAETVTVSMWLNILHSPYEDAVLAEKWTGSGAYPYSLRLTTARNIQFAASDGTNTTTLTTTSPLTAGDWVHVAGVRTKGGEVAVYVNGVKQVTTTDVATGTSTNTGPLAIAYRNSTYASSYYGTLDEIKIFSRALTENEVEAEYDAGQAGQRAGLAFAQDLISGTPQNMEAQAVIQTDAPGYNLAISQNQNLTSGTNTIPAVSNGGTITDPAAWINGTTVGLGFTLTGTNATALPGKWNSGNSYAAVPGGATTFYSRTGYATGVKDTLNIRYRLDVARNQAAGSYANTVTYTGTMTP